MQEEDYVKEKSQLVICKARLLSILVFKINNYLENIKEEPLKKFKKRRMKLSEEWFDEVIFMLKKKNVGAFYLRKMYEGLQGVF